MISCIWPCCVFMFIPHNLMSRAEFPVFLAKNCPCRHELAGGRLAFSPQQRLELFLRGLSLAPKRSRPSSYVTVWSPSDWWFGTFGLFFHILGIIIPTDELIFFRGVETTNQPWFYRPFPPRSSQILGAIWSNISIWRNGNSNLLTWKVKL